MENQKSILKAAICDFKAKVDKITKDKENPFFKSRYADLAIILEVIDKDLAATGLTLNSYTQYQDGQLILKTDLSHKDTSEVISSIFPVFGAKAQELGSSITYARRYNIQSLLNLAAEDDDGNAANAATEKPLSAAEKKRKYQNYLDSLAKVANKEMLDTIKTYQNGWIAWTKINYGQEYVVQLNNKFLELEQKFNGNAAIDDELPDFLKTN